MFKRLPPQPKIHRQHPFGNAGSEAVAFGFEAVAFGLDEAEDVGVKHPEVFHQEGFLGADALQFGHGFGDAPLLEAGEGAGDVSVRYLVFADGQHEKSPVGIDFVMGIVKSVLVK